MLSGIPRVYVPSTMSKYDTYLQKVVKDGRYTGFMCKLCGDWRNNPFTDLSAATKHLKRRHPEVNMAPSGKAMRQVSFPNRSTDVLLCLLQLLGTTQKLGVWIVLHNMQKEAIDMLTQSDMLKLPWIGIRGPGIDNVILLGARNWL